MSQDPRPKDKAEEESQRPPKPPGYRKFEKMLKQVVKAPPMRKAALSRELDK